MYSLHQLVRVNNDPYIVTGRALIKSVKNVESAKELFNATVVLQDEWFMHFCMPIEEAEILEISEPSEKKPFITQFKFESLEVKTINNSKESTPNE